jgi:soluble lytic murein transglycosylase-like protein
MWTNEDAFNAVISDVSARYRVPVALIKAIIGQESQFNPKAYRAEPQINDASRGLMQLLAGTAKALGYSGAADGLYDPTTNIGLGTKYLADLLNNAASNGWGIESAVSAYNAGGSADRAGDGKRSTSRKDGTTDGSVLAPFVNQAYVNAVMKNYQYFQGKGTVTPVGLPVVQVTASPNVSPLPLILAGLAIVAVVALLTRSGD